MNTPQYHILNFLRKAIKYRLMFILAMSLLNIGNTFAQVEKNIFEYVSFFYVDNPNSESAKVYKLDNDGIFFGKKEGPFWADSTIAPLQQLVEAIVGQTAGEDRGGDFMAQHIAEYICNILDKPVQVWLYNDHEPLEDDALEKYGPCTDLFGYVWPCANSFSKDEKKSEDWAGYMHLGVTNMASNLEYIKGQPTRKDSIEASINTFLHMLAHTQDRSDLRAHVFHPYETDKWYDLGEMGKYYYVEAVPTMQLAYQEGIASAYVLDYSQQETNRTLEWFYNNDYLLVEAIFDSTDIGLKAKTQLYDRIREAAGEGDPVPNMPNYRGYKIRDLPPKFIIHNEMVIGLIFSSCLVTLGEWNFNKAIRKTQQEAETSLKPINPVATLFKYVSEALLPEGETVLSVFNLPEDQRKSYLLPLALADYFTAYNSQDKSTFSEIFDRELPQPWIDLYWDTMREKVRNNVPLGGNPISPEDEDEILGDRGVVEIKKVLKIIQ